MKLTKIFATIGPASGDRKTLEKLCKAGMNVARLNFSHGAYEKHAEYIKHIRDAAKKTKSLVGILQDLQGPRIRLGVLPEEGILLEKGKKYVLTNQKKEKVNGLTVIPVKFPQLSKTVKVGEPILIADGTRELEVVDVTKDIVTVKVIRGGKVTSNKGLNFPKSEVNVPVITPKDKKDLEFGVRHGVDYVAISFVKDASNIAELRKLIAKHEPNPEKQPRVIVKIERPEALKNLEEIVEATDVVMVARGDLGIEIPAAHVPIEQKRIINYCLHHGKTVITATQMLESMTSSPIATRAEVSDVANAIWDLTDAVMLSGETATGEYPVEAVELMSHIAEECEEYAQYVENDAVTEMSPIGLGLAGAVEMAQYENSRFIVITNLDYKVRQLASFRSNTPIEVVTSNPKMEQWCAAIRGVQKVHIVSKRKLAKITRDGSNPIKKIDGVRDILVVGMKGAIKLIVSR